MNPFHATNVYAIAHDGKEWHMFLGEPEIINNRCVVVPLLISDRLRFFAASDGSRVKVDPQNIFLEKDEEAAKKRLFKMRLQDTEALNEN